MIMEEEENNNSKMCFESRQGDKIFWTKGNASWKTTVGPRKLHFSLRKNPQMFCMIIAPARKSTKAKPYLLIHSFWWM
jgi:hypothetical protein